MKNATPKSNTAKKNRTAVEFLREYLHKHKDDFSKLYVLLGLGLVCAILIQERIGIDHFFGSFFIAAMILFIFYRDIKRYKPAYLNNHKMMLLPGLHRGLVLPGSGAYLFGIPIPLGAMLVTLIFDFHTAIIFSFVTSIMT